MATAIDLPSGLPQPRLTPGAGLISLADLPELEEAISLPVSDSRTALKANPALKLRLLFDLCVKAKAHIFGFMDEKLESDELTSAGITFLELRQAS